MERFLEKIRAKPKRYKVMFAWWVSGGITIMIALLWFFTYHAPHKGGQSFYEGIASFFKSPASRADDISNGIHGLFEGAAIGDETATTSPTDAGEPAPTTSDSPSYPGLFVPAQTPK